jgi:D-3-phosphoglycerate dehydrogenase
VQLQDSLISAVTGADYISINIPYTPGSGGTHGIIGKQVVESFKPGAVLLNFARGELVDSDALRFHLDEKDGRYISDFPDDVLWDHKNAVILPHLGACTKEAEDAAAAMAVDTIREFLEDGNIYNSVNFPTTFLPPGPKDSLRFTVVNRNLPGRLAAITEAFAANGLNIIQQVNHSRGIIAYNIIDVDTSGHDDVLSFKEVQVRITNVKDVLSTRVLFFPPGSGYLRNEHQ